MKSKKKIILIILPLIILIGAVIYIKSTDNKTEKQATATQQISTKTPREITKQPEKYLNKEVTVTGRLVHANPDIYVVADQDTKSPTAIRLDFSKSKIDPTQYILTPTAKTPTLTSLPATDTSEQGNKLAVQAKPNPPKKQKTILTFKGTLIHTMPKTPLVLVVTTVQ